MTSLSAIRRDLQTQPGRMEMRSALAAGVLCCVAVIAVALLVVGLWGRV